MMRAALTLVLFLLTAPSLAQTEPKDEPIVSTCPQVQGPISFCGSAPEFALTPQIDNADVTTYYATPEDIQAITIIEELGLRNGMTITGLQGAALEILSRSSGQSPSQIPILERASLTVDGQNWPNFVYSGTIGDTEIVYSNTIVLLDASLAQFVTLEIGVTTYSPRHRDLHSRFLANVQVTQ